MQLRTSDRKGRDSSSVNVLSLRGSFLAFIFTRIHVPVPLQGETDRRGKAPIGAVESSSTNDPGQSHRCNDEGVALSRI